jgi:hypothetical protein
VSDRTKDPATDAINSAGHLSEIAEILALGLTRVGAPKSSPKTARFGESSLHFSTDQSGDAASFSTEICT